MHFDARTQRALREAGLDADAIAAASDRVAELVDEDADRLREFFEPAGPYHSDMETAHSTAERQEHASADVDLFTHGSDLRGYLSLDGWGVPVEGGRVLRTAETGGVDGGSGETAGDGEGEGGDADEVPVLVELSLGATVHDRVRFARDPDEL
ncbi:DUF7532 family protein [Halorubrum lipolyticum]|uniref:Uncharacterized protein n=1 Tax=Halorubrum lipolyticum DSM 21995 TaxID=1227482 RepID=M0NVS9_9EURY|nr:hypothetical protein [Halorubrum lipolyticum]EMA60685.1 hypothetical protein C469_08513 [Halorubrum lipolyticum DSM 21995]